MRWYCAIQWSFACVWFSLLSILLQKWMKQLKKMEEQKSKIEKRRNTHKSYNLWSQNILQFKRIFWENSNFSTISIFSEDIPFDNVFFDYRESNEKNKVWNELWTDLSMCMYGPCECICLAVQIKYIEIKSLFCVSQLLFAWYDFFSLSRFGHICYMFSSCKYCEIKEFVVNISHFCRHYREHFVLLVISI